MKLTAIMTTELKVDPTWRGLQVARIEAWVESPGEDFRHEVGKIETWNNPELFDAVRAAIHHGLEPKEPSEVSCKDDWTLLADKMDNLLDTLGVPRTEGVGGGGRLATRIPGLSSLRAVSFRALFEVGFAPYPVA